MNRRRMDVIHQFLPFIGNMKVGKSRIKIRLRITFADNQKNMGRAFDFRPLSLVTDGLQGIVKRVYGASFLFNKGLYERQVFCRASLQAFFYAAMPQHL